MDRQEGVEGWMTLLHFDNRPIPNPESIRALTNVQIHYKDCRAKDVGNVIGWLRTPRKGYGGIQEGPSNERCGYF